MSSRLPTKPKLPTLADKGSAKYNRYLRTLFARDIFNLLLTMLAFVVALHVIGGGG